MYSSFCRFSDKTKNEWDERDAFQKVQGKYDLVFVDYNADEVLHYFYVVCLFSIVFNLVCLHTNKGSVRRQTRRIFTESNVRSL